MTPPIEYIHIPASVLMRQDLSAKAKMLLSLIIGFNARGLMMSNPELAKVLRTHPNHIPRLLARIKNQIRIENPQSRYRKVFYVDSQQSDEILLPHKERSRHDLL